MWGVSDKEGDEASTRRTESGGRVLGEGWGSDLPSPPARET